MCAATGQSMSCRSLVKSTAALYLAVIFTALTLLLVGGCKKPSATPATNPVAADTPPWRYEQDSAAGAIRVCAVNPQDGRRVLIHVLADGRKMSDRDLGALAASEAEASRRWHQASVPDDPSLHRRHDALLGAAESLEACHDLVAAHLGILRDLLIVYGNLLAFEERTSLGSNIFLLAGAGADDFQRLAQPLDRDDARMIQGLRAWLFFVMRAWMMIRRPRA